jgi:hypothetical protein
MAQTTGLVQRLNIVTETIACVWIGPTPNNTTALVVTNDGSAGDSAFANSLIQLLGTASANYREVVAFHADTGSKITSVRLDTV